MMNPRTYATVCAFLSGLAIAGASRGYPWFSAGCAMVAGFNLGALFVLKMLSLGLMRGTSSVYESIMIAVDNSPAAAKALGAELAKRDGGLDA